MHLAGHEVNRAVVRLALPFIGEGYDERSIAVAPPPATGSPPHPMTFTSNHTDRKQKGVNYVVH